MTRPPLYPPPQFPPVRLRPFQRMPPAVFPPVLGLLGLGLALRKAAELFALPPAIPEMLLGAVTLLWLFAALAYLAKLWQRPGVVLEDLRILPGRAGLAAATMGLLLVAVVLLPYAPLLARGVLLLGLSLHGVLAFLVALVLLRGPKEARDVTPVWHLTFVGFILGGLSAAPLGWSDLGVVLLIGTASVAALIWAVSIKQLVERIPPAPLRPLLAIHLSPAALFGLVAGLSGLEMLAQLFAALGALILLALVVSLRWLLVAGISPLWGALTFPLAAYAGLLLSVGWQLAGAVLLGVAMAVIPPIALHILQHWVRGSLAAKTNAATA